jgi:hypothetical protein
MEAVAEIEARMERARGAFDTLKAELARRIVGHEELVELSRPKKARLSSWLGSWLKTS